jgi:hypothetical protein
MADGCCWKASEDGAELRVRSGLRGAHAMFLNREGEEEFSPCDWVVFSFAAVGLVCSGVRWIGKFSKCFGRDNAIRQNIWAWLGASFADPTCRTRAARNY